MAGSEDVLGVKTKIDELQWTLVMEQPHSTAYQPINEMMRNTIMAVAIVTLIVSLISIYSGLNFTKPIVILEKAMKNLKFGYQIEPVQMARNDEIGKLAKSFNEMGQVLQEKSVRLAQEKERLDVVVDGIGAGLALVTKEYQVTWMNPILQGWLNEAQLSLPCYSLIGGVNAPCENCPVTRPESGVNIDKLMNQKTANGEEKIFRHRVFPLNHAIEEEGEFLLVIEDITEQKQMEEKIIQTDKLSALGLMASGFAHEVNNPLATIHAYAEDLLDRIHTNDEQLDQEEINSYLNKIKENTERCKKITGNMLNFSRESKWSLSYVDINETVQNSVSLVEYSLKKHQIQLDVNVEKDLPELFGDSLKLMQVLVNLINNAVDAMEEGGTITLLAKKEGNSILLKVADTGTGISREVLPKIFDPFYTTKSVGKGTGLGLSVCYGIIQQFGGTIQIQSEHGAGTTVDILLPSGLTTGERDKWLQ
ncbi:ATP-binding protein [Bacillus sp. V33-4]|uniref:ATP-binding protein n=1 Tax=Bacillus sp. V33-4 TaxID=2054169 RepID=UPI002155927D|nr:ATP-binding protein [Bacillus sp. V33-4]